MNFLRSPADGFDGKPPTTAGSMTPRHDVVSSSQSVNRTGQVNPMANFALPFVPSAPCSSSSSSSSSSSMMMLSGGRVQMPIEPGQMAADSRVRPPLPPSSPTVRSSTDVNTPRMELANEAMWADFHRLTNEMVVCRTGRKMFPKIELKLSGLNADMNYFILLSMRLVDSNRYKFQAGSWSTAGHDNVSERSNSITHHEGLNGSGEFWMRNTISFDRVKLTNTQKAEGSMIGLSSMHKYQPVLQLYSCMRDSEPLIVLEPPVMQFIAVTAYQNELITRLKIAYNPFAKGFREGSARKRSYSPTSGEILSASHLTSPPMKRADAHFPQFNPAAFLQFPLGTAANPTVGFPSNFHFNQFNFNNPHQLSINSANISSINNNNFIPTNGSSMMLGPKAQSTPTAAVSHADYMNMFSGLDALSQTAGYNQLFGGQLPAYLTSSFAAQAGATPSAAMLATMLAAGQSSFQQQYQQQQHHHQQLTVSRSDDNSAGDETSASPSTDNDSSLMTLPSPTVPKTEEE